MANVEHGIFKRASSTFFIASLFFPKRVKADVFDLYSFVRTADDYVDQVPADADNFYELRRIWLEAVEFKQVKSDDTLNVRVVKNMRRLQELYNLDPLWAETFLNTMQQDLVRGSTSHKKLLTRGVTKDQNINVRGWTSHIYQTLDDCLGYVYGSAEVVGLMMNSVMGLPHEAQEAARMQGRAFQWINFIRDVEEDNQLGRQYFPDEDLKQFSLPDLSRETATSQSEDFAKFMRYQIDRYKKWQQEAEAGYHFIPKRLLIPLKTAVDSYTWTANQIAQNPHVIFDKKVKPSKFRVVYFIARQTLTR